MFARITGADWGGVLLPLKKVHYRPITLSVYSLSSRHRSETPNVLNDASLFLFTIQHTYTHNNQQLSDCTGANIRVEWLIHGTHFSNTWALYFHLWRLKKRKKQTNKQTKHPPYLSPSSNCSNVWYIKLCSSPSLFLKLENSLLQLIIIKTMSINTDIGLKNSWIRPKSEKNI